MYTYETPSYANSGGTGDRTALITVSENIGFIYPSGSSASYLVNGIDPDAKQYLPDTAAVAGKYIQFVFGDLQLITEATWYQSFSNDSHGVWKWQGSILGSIWVDIGTSFTLGGAIGASVQTSLSGNATGYKYYRLLGVSGYTNTNPYINEITFKIAPGITIAAGSVTSTVPSTVGSYIVCIGKAITTEILDIEISQPIRL
jgi:hypothetical protein